MTCITFCYFNACSLSKTRVLIMGDMCLFGLIYI